MISEAGDARARGNLPAARPRRSVGADQGLIEAEIEAEQVLAEDGKAEHDEGNADHPGERADRPEGEAEEPDRGRDQTRRPLPGHAGKAGKGFRQARKGSCQTNRIRPPTKATTKRSKRASRNDMRSARGAGSAILTGTSANRLPHPRSREMSRKLWALLGKRPQRSERARSPTLYRVIA